MDTNDKSGITTYVPHSERYTRMQYRRAGTSGLRLPALSLGLWHNFGFVDNLHTARAILRAAFDHGIVHWDAANNYGPPYGSAEQNLGMLLTADFAAHRDELVIATKAGFDMWPGPYGDGGSRKYLIASLDQSLHRLGLDYVDIFYHHRRDPQTPLEETLSAIRDVIRQGKALYAGISNYDPLTTREAAAFFREEKVPFVLHQARYSLLERTVERGLLDTLVAEGVGCIAFSPLAQGLLTGRYLEGVPVDSRAARPFTYLGEDEVRRRRATLVELNEVASGRGQTLAQMAIAWLLTRPAVCTVLIGASSPRQLVENVQALEASPFSDEELARIDTILEQNR
ncbi:MAG TPA: aldo/keto reductase [Woeseiaceae bacterium]|nr:aldo/keto reductase [Woeseiaceae bacterium]